MNAFAVVPVKKLHRAKTRLSSLLSSNERRKLCLKMLKDVLVAVTTARRIRWTVIVSGDPTVLQLAKRFRVSSLTESQPGLNRAVSEAIDWCIQNGAKSTVILPADIPSVTPRDVDRFLSLGIEEAMVISPSRSEDGTNALLLTPPTALPIFYGKHSFQRYVMEASKRAIRFRIIELPRIALDIDTVEDLVNFVKLNAKETFTYKFLMEIGISQRLSKL